MGSQLLENGKLTKRVTMIPLNKIQAFVASAEKVATASNVSRNSAHLALSLVGYEDQVSAAMEYVFGNTLICPSADVAKAVTFHPSIKMKSVTLEGDVYDPSGTLSGGSKPSTSGVLVKVQELRELENQLKSKKEVLQKAEAQWDAVKEKVRRWKEQKRDLDLKSHEVTLLEERVKESNATRVRAGISSQPQTVWLSDVPICLFSQRSSRKSNHSKRRLQISKKALRVAKRSKRKLKENASDSRRK